MLIWLQPHRPSQEFLFADVINVCEIQAAIKKLPLLDLEELAAWFADYHNQQWDEQIELDLAGRLNALLEEAEAEYEAGQARPL